jgi:prepilin-type N-terminal cleavage/methylation domain-containing protein
MTAKFLKESDAGFTLIELMAAMVILTFGVVAALQILVEAHKSNNFARAKTMAVNRAEEHLEWIFRDFPTNVDNYDDLWFAVGDLVGPGPAGEPGHITVTDPALADPCTVTITVNWQGQGTLHAGNVTITAFRSTVERN